MKQPFDENLPPPDSVYNFLHERRKAKCELRRELEEERERLRPVEYQQRFAPRTDEGRSADATPER